MNSLYLGVSVILASMYSYLGLVQPTINVPQEQEQNVEIEVIYNKKQYDEILENGGAVILHFTAEWCIYCKYQEPNYNSDVINNIAKANNIIKMKVDLTKNDSENLKLLRSFKRNSIPTYVYSHKNFNHIFNGWPTETGFKQWIENNLKKHDQKVDNKL